MPRNVRAAETESAPAGKGKAGKGRGRGKGSQAPESVPASGKASGKGASKRRAQERAAAEGEERTAISKKVTWVLRHGIRRLGLDATGDGWVKLGDVLSTKILEDVTEDKVLKMIEATNVEKLRYEVKESDGVKIIRAVSKIEREGVSGEGDAEEKAPDSGLRHDAPVFVPQAPLQGAMMPMATYPMGALPCLGLGVPGVPGTLPGYPWQPGGFGGLGFPPMMPGAGVGVPGLPVVTPASPGEGRYQGRIKSFNTEKGFGFIESAEAHAQFGRDVFVHRSIIGSLTVGTQVSFTVETNKQGMPQAKELTATQGQAPAAFAAPVAEPSGRKGGANKEKGKGSGKGKSGGRRGAA